MVSKLDDIRAAVAECSVVEDGATQEDRQRENTRRMRVYRMLDTYYQELAAGTTTSGEDVKALQRELEALASTLVIRPIQPKSRRLFEVIDLVWRVPAVVLFLLFMGFVVSIPLIVLTMIEQQLFLALNRWQSAPPPGSGGGKNSGRFNTGADKTKVDDPSSATASVSLSAEALTHVNGTPPPGPGEGSAPAAPIAKAGYSPDDACASTPALGDDSATPYSSSPKEHGGRGARERRGRRRGNSGGLSSILIRLDCAWLLLLMGIRVRAEGLSERSLSRPAMLLFTHVSTLDAVVILGTLPRALCAVVKEELLAVPVLGWIMASRGAIPINRGHRASAVQALAEAAERARELEMFVAMAPEGTRSKTGQLGPFKKGPLHMQEQLGWPVIPVTIRGAYELFPLKWNVNQCGKVVVQYHKPIEASEIKSREGLSRRLRQEMLEALVNDVPEAGTPLDPPRRAASIAATAVTYWATARVGKAVVSFSQREGVAMWALLVGAAAYVSLSTVFVFFVYARKVLSRPHRRLVVDGDGGGGCGVRNGDARVARVRGNDGVELVGGGGGGRAANGGGVNKGDIMEVSPLLASGKNGSQEPGPTKDR